MAEILFVGEYCGFVGGVERYMARSAYLLSRHGHHVSGLAFRETADAQLFCSSFKKMFRFDQLLLERPRFDLVVVHKIPSAHYLKKLKELYRVVIFVHDHEYYCPRKSYYHPFTRKNCRFSYHPLCCTLCASLKRPRGWREPPFNLGIPFLRLWREVKKSERFIVISSFMRGILIRQGIPEEAVSLIPPAIGHYGGASPENAERDARLLVLGQLIKGKGVDQLLDALPMIRHHFALDILGTGNAERELKRQAAKFGDKVRFHNWTSEPEKYLLRAYAVILPWRWQEPFGLVGPEALAHGAPLVGFDVGGIREYLIDGETGLLVPPGDIPGLARAIDALLDDPAGARRMAENGRKLVEERFSEEKFIAGWDAFIREAVK